MTIPVEPPVRARPGGSRMRRERVVGGTLILSSGAMLPVALTGALAVRLQEGIGVGEAWIGAAVSAYFIGGGLAGITVSRRVDRQGWRRSSTEAAVLCAASLAVIAVWGRAWWVLALALFLAGIAFTVQVPAGNVAVSREVPPERLGTLLGVTQTASPLAMMLAGLAVPTIALVLDWRTVFAIAVAWPVVGALVLPWRGAPAVAVVAEGARSRVEGVGIIAAASFFGSCVPGALTAFFVVSAVGSGMSESAAGTLLAVSSVAGLLVRAGAGVLADRSGTDGYRPVAWLLVVGAAGLLILAVGTPLSTVVGGIMAFAGGWGWPGLWFYALVRSHMGAAGAVTGAVQSGGMIGSAVGPLAFGLTAQATSVGVAWTVIAAATVLSALLVRRAAPRALELGV